MDLHTPGGLSMGMSLKMVEEGTLAVSSRSCLHSKYRNSHGEAENLGNGGNSS
jgi:hypothetical protein